MNKSLLYCDLPNNNSGCKQIPTDLKIGDEVLVSFSELFYEIKLNKKEEYTENLISFFNEIYKTAKRLGTNKITLEFKTELNFIYPYSNRIIF